MSEVVLEDVVKTYGDVVAVDHVSFTIKDGEFIALVGPSGCGKTTTLNMVAGLIELTSGTITSAADILLQRGATEVWAMATHGVLSGPAVDPELQRWR